MNIDIMQ